MALSANRNTDQMGVQDRRKVYPVKANAKIYQGALVALDANGFAIAGATATTLKGAGRAEQFVDATGLADGAVSVEVAEGIFKWLNSTAGDALAQADVGAAIFIVDDETVAKTNGGATRSKAGVVEQVDTDGVWVRIAAWLAAAI